MCIHIYIYVYIYLYVYTYTYVFLHLFLYNYVYIHICILILYVNMYMYMYVYIYICITRTPGPEECSHPSLRMDYRASAIPWFLLPSPAAAGWEDYVARFGPTGVHEHKATQVERRAPQRRIPEPGGGCSLGWCRPNVAPNIIRIGKKLACRTGNRWELCRPGALLLRAKVVGGLCVPKVSRPQWNCVFCICS